MRKIGLAFLYLFTVITMVTAADPPGKNLSGNYMNNRTPLLTKPYMELPIGNIKPSSWLDEQLNRMVTGMTGHMDTIYEQVMGPRNGWLGGGW